MKPKKNRIYCPLANRAKMLFESKDEADRFIEFNSEDFTGNKKPTRAYYCTCCGGWHITSKDNIHISEEKDIEKQEKVINKMIQSYSKDIENQKEIEDINRRKLNKQITSIEQKIGKKDKYKTKSKEQLLSYLDEIKQVEDFMNANKKETLSRARAYHRLNLLRDKIFQGLVFNVYRKIVDEIREVRKLILLFENKERTDEMLNEIEKEVTELEEKLGYSKLTEDLRKRIMDTREGK